MCFFSCMCSSLLLRLWNLDTLSEAPLVKSVYCITKICRSAPAITISIYNNLGPTNRLAPWLAPTRTLVVLSWFLVLLVWPARTSHHSSRFALCPISATHQTRPTDRPSPPTHVPIRLTFTRWESGQDQECIRLCNLMCTGSMYVAHYDMKVRRSLFSSGPFLKASWAFLGSKT